MGKRKRNETGLQLHVVLPSQKRRLDLGQSGQKHPGLLDRTHQTLPGDQSSHGIGTGRSLHHEPVDPRRQQGGTGQPIEIPPDPEGIAGRDLRHALFPHEGLHRSQTVRHRFGKLHRRLVRFLPGLRCQIRKDRYPGYGTLPPDGKHRGQDLVPAAVHPRDHAARKPPHPVG